MPSLAPPSLPHLPTHHLPLLSPFREWQASQGLKQSMAHESGRSQFLKIQIFLQKQGLYSKGLAGLAADSQFNSHQPTLLKTRGFPPF